jgi:hypothetical protein
MTAKRTPLNRQRRKLQSTPKAIRLFIAMERVECTCAPRDWAGEYWKHTLCAGCDEWWRLHSELDKELGCRPWQWPCVEPPDAENPYPEGSYAAARWQPNLEAQERWRLLKEAAARRSRSSSSSSRNALKPPD